MMRHDGAALRVLYLGGTGTISTSCVRLSVESGMSVFVLNRGNNSASRKITSTDLLRFSEARR